MALVSTYPPQILQSVVGRKNVSRKYIHQEKECMVNEGVENNIMHTSNHTNPLPLSGVKWCGPRGIGLRLPWNAYHLHKPPRGKS